MKALQRRYFWEHYKSMGVKTSVKVSLKEHLGILRERHKGFDHELSHSVEGYLIGFM